MNVLAETVSFLADKQRGFAPVASTCRGRGRLTLLILKVRPYNAVMLELLKLPLTTSRCATAGEKVDLFRRFLFVGLLFLMPLLAAGPSLAQSGFASSLNRSDFNAISIDLSTIDFESVAPAKGGFGKYPVEEGLTVNRAGFRTSGGGKFGAGMILVLSGSYALTNPMYNTGSGAVLAWGPPNQPGDAYLDVSLPGGVYAVGADLWTGQPFISTVDVTVTNTEGKTQTITVDTRSRPGSSFAGFVSDEEIRSVRFQIPKRQAWLFLDNFTYGRKREGVNIDSLDSATETRNTSGSETAMSRPDIRIPAVPRTSAPEATSPVRQAGNDRTNGAAARNEPTNNPVQSNRNNAAVSNAESIAYVRGSEIRLVEPDGTNDRKIWTPHQAAKESSSVHELAWRPDRKELAFSSSHANLVSFYHADLYAIRPDGTGLRKITNAPDRSELGTYPKGSVSVTVRNTQPIGAGGRASAGEFIIYVVGADGPQGAVVPPGSSRTLTFKSVADFGDRAQPIVAIHGQYRWFIPGVDVKAGRTVSAPNFDISGDGIPAFGAYRPIWRADGSRLSYRDGLCILSTVPANPTPGEIVFKSLFSGKEPMGSCTWDFGPSAALADEIIYTSNGEEDGSNVMRIKEGGTHPGAKIHSFFSEADGQILNDLRWLTDGSGFLYTFPNHSAENGNVYRYDIRTKNLTKLTNFEGEYARSLDISPDGAWVVFERVKSLEDENSDLWVMATDGSKLRLLVRNGKNPAW